jgi:hypothetical protein
MFIARADNVTAERDTVAGRAEFKSMIIPGEIAVSIRRKEIDVISLRTECECDVTAHSCIKDLLIERDVAIRQDRSGNWNAILFRGIEIIGQEPSADVHVRSFQIAQFQKAR